MRIGDGVLRRLGWLLLTGFALLAGVDLALIAHTRPATSTWGVSGSSGVVAELVMLSLFPVTGQLIVRRRPRNRIGWLLHAIGVAWAIGLAVEIWVLTAMVLWPGSLPGGPVADVLDGATWLPPIGLTGVYLLLLFPDGRLPTPRWRGLAWLAGVAMVAGVAGIVLRPGPVTDGRVPLARNPIGLSHAVADVMLTGLALLPVCILAAAAAVVLRFRRSRGVPRVQLKWLMAVGAAIAAMYGVALVGSFFVDSDAAPPLWLAVLESVSILSFGLLPVAIGVAITRYGLYGIDALISRALTVAVLGAFITVVYVGIVAGAGTLIGQRHPSVWLSVAATGLVAVAFQPVRERVQRAVNRLVYGERASPYEVLADFATRMAGRYTTSELMPPLAQTLATGLRADRVEIWLRSGPGFTLEGAWPDDAPGPRFRPRDHDRPAPRDGERVVPVRHREEQLGRITVYTTEPLGAAEAAMLDHVASQAGLVLRNLALVEDLQQSRRRLVTAQDDERRRLERDLHDGAQQSLVSVAILLQVAAGQTERESALAGLAAASDQLGTAIAELRELAHGIHPAVLTERGLPAAVQRLAGRAGVPVTVDSDLDRRLPAPVEATLYFVVAEGLANIAKYAHAGRVGVTIRDAGDTVAVAVQDDGVGGADIAGGTGLLGLTDRLAAVDGTLDLHSPPGAGTRLRCHIPLVTSPVDPMVTEAPVVTEAPAEPVAVPVGST